jgi:hypothetical protein
VTGWIDPGTSEKKNTFETKSESHFGYLEQVSNKMTLNRILHYNVKNVLEMTDTWRDVCPRTGPDLWRCKRRFPSPTAPPSRTGVAWGQSSGHLRSCLFVIIFVRLLECKDEKSLRKNICL